MATSVTRKNGGKGVRAKFARRPVSSRRGKREPESSFLTLVDDLRRIGASVPIKEWKKLPPDFNENLDHYLYGSPRKRVTRKGQGE